MLNGPGANVALLVLLLAMLAWFLRNDGKEYAAFKRLTATEDRQRAFRRWTVKSFRLFVGAGLAVLLLLGRPDALLHMPAQFTLAADWIARRLSDGGEGEGGGAAFVLLIAGAMLAGGLIGGIVAARIARKRGGEARQAALGDIEPLFPRNRAERGRTALMGANAALGEEIFFRLVLPLLLAQLTGDAFLAFGIAALLFGAVHFYQGWAGIVGTTLAGLLFTAVYLASGHLWVAVLLHALMNLNTLWLRPLLKERSARRGRGAGGDSGGKA